MLASDCKEQLGSDVVFSEATLRRRISDNLDASSSNSTFDDTSISMSIVPQKSKLFLRFNPIVRLRVQFQDLMVLQDPVLVCYVMAYSNSSTEGPIKAIVFSQWTSMLDLVEISLNQYCIQYRRLDGTLTLSSRDRAVKDLNTDPKVWPLPHEFSKQS